MGVEWQPESTAPADVVVLVDDEHQGVCTAQLLIIGKSRYWLNYPGAYESEGFDRVKAWALLPAGCGW